MAGEIIKTQQTERKCVRCLRTLKPEEKGMQGLCDSCFSVSSANIEPEVMTNTSEMCLKIVAIITLIVGVLVGLGFASNGYEDVGIIMIPSSIISSAFLYCIAQISHTLRKIEDLLRKLKK